MANLRCKFSTHLPETLTKTVPTIQPRYSKYLFTRYGTYLPIPYYSRVSYKYVMKPYILHKNEEFHVSHLHSLNL